MPTPLRELADLVQGKLNGDGETPITEALPLSEAADGCISFLGDANNLQLLKSCQASALLVPIGTAVKNIPTIEVKDPLNSFVKIFQHFRGITQSRTPGIDPRAAVDYGCQIGEETWIGPFAIVGEGSVIGKRCQIHGNAVIGRNCRLGDDVSIYPNAVLYDETILGDRTIIHANSVIGGDGFGYRLQEGRHVKIPQLGNIEIGDDVEIGACTTIDRGTFHATRIGNGTKIDNLVQLGHNCQIGQHNLLVSQIGMGGSSSTGDYVVIAGQAGLVDHIHIGEGAVIGAKAGVTKDVPPKGRMLGAPATPEREQKRILMCLEKLPEIRKDINRIKQQLDLPDESAA